MERIGLEVEGDVSDAVTAMETLTRVLERYEGAASRAARTPDIDPVDEVDIQKAARMTRQMEELNREMMKAAGFRFAPGGAGGGGTWTMAAAPSRPDPIMQEWRGDFQQLTRKLDRIFTDDLAGGRGDVAGAVRYLQSRDIDIRVDNDRFGEAVGRSLGRSLIGGGGGGGGGGRGSLGGFFGYGGNDRAFQLGDIYRGILPGGTRQSVGAVASLAAMGFGAGAAATPGIAGLGLAGVAGLGAAAANIAAITAALSGLGEAIGGNKEEFDKLSKSAQAFVLEVRGFIPWLEKLREIGRENMLPGLAEGLNALLSPAMVSNLESGFAAISKNIGDLATEWGRFLGSEEMADRFGRFLQNSVGWTQDFSDAAMGLVDALTQMVDAGAPFINWVSAGIARGGEWVATWTDAKVASGEFAAFLGEGQRSIEAFGDLLGSAIGLVVELGAVLKGPALNAMELIGDAFDDLAQIIDRNQDEIEDFINGGINAIADTIRFLSPIVRDLISLIDTVVEALGGWELAFQAIIAIQLASVISSWVGAIATLIGAEAAAGGAGLLGAAGAATRLEAVLLRLQALGPIALVIGLDILIDKFTGDSDDFFNKIGSWITDRLPIPQEWKDTLNTPVRGGIPVTVKPGDPSAGARNRDADAASRGSQRGQGSLQLPTSWAGTHVTSGLDWNDGQKTAVDIFASAGTPVGAPEDGVAYAYKKTGAQGGGSIRFRGDSGWTYWIGHITQGVTGRLSKGDTIAYVSGDIDTPHVHIDKKQTAQIPSPAAGKPPPFDAKESGAGSASWDDFVPDPVEIAVANADARGDSGPRITARRKLVESILANLSKMPAEVRKEARLKVADLRKEIRQISLDAQKTIDEEWADKVQLTRAEFKAVRAADRTEDLGDDIAVRVKIMARLRQLLKSASAGAKPAIRQAIDELDEDIKDLWARLAERQAKSVADAAEEIADSLRKFAAKVAREAEENTKKIEKAVKDAERLVSAAWDDYARMTLEQFDKVASSYRSPLRAQLEEDQAAFDALMFQRRLQAAELALEYAKDPSKDPAALERAAQLREAAIDAKDRVQDAQWELEDAQKALAEMLAPKPPDSGGGGGAAGGTGSSYEQQLEEQLRRVREIYTRYGRADAIDAAQSSVLGIPHVSQFGEGFKREMDAALAPITKQAESASGAVRDIGRSATASASDIERANVRIQRAMRSLEKAQKDAADAATAANNALVPDPLKIQQAEEEVTSLKLQARWRLVEEDEKAMAERNARERVKLEESLAAWRAWAIEVAKTMAAATGNPEAAAEYAQQIAQRQQQLGGTPEQFRFQTPRDFLMLAEGGIATRPTVAMVGEDGAEAVLPLRDRRAQVWLREVVRNAQGTPAGDTNVHVSFASGMEWLRELMRVTVKQELPHISLGIGHTAQRRVRSGRIGLQGRIING